MAKPRIDDIKRVIADPLKEKEFKTETSLEMQITGANFDETGKVRAVLSEGKEKIKWVEYTAFVSSAGGTTLTFNAKPHGRAVRGPGELTVTVTNDERGGKSSSTKKKFTNVTYVN
jgi:hypothetical protein